MGWEIKRVSQQTQLVPPQIWPALFFPPLRRRLPVRAPTAMDGEKQRMDQARQHSVHSGMTSSISTSVVRYSYQDVCGFASP